MEHSTPLIATIVVGLSLAFIFGVVAQRLGMSPLVGYLLAGVVVGPFTPGWVADLGLVAVGIRDERELSEEWERMAHRLREAGKEADVAGFLVQEAAVGVEVFAGVSRDPDFGLVLAFGAGGVMIEALGDVALRALPLREGDAEAMITHTRVATLLGGFRGRPPADVPALGRCLDAIADFAWAERDAIAEIDVNPIMVRARGEGCVVVDALIVPRA